MCYDGMIRYPYVAWKQSSSKIHYFIELRNLDLPYLLAFICCVESHCGCYTDSNRTLLQDEILITETLKIAPFVRQ